MARNIDYTGSLGIGDNAVLGTYDNGILGQTYTITNADILDSVSFILISPPAGVPVRVDIYNTIAGVPTGSPIGSTTSYTTTINDNLNGVALTLPISISPLNLTAGTYYFGVIEEAGNITIATSEKIFTTNTVFIKWDANPNGAAVWSAVESFGASFERSFVINPVFKTCIDANIDFATTADMCLVGNGTITATVTGGTGAFTYSWEGSPETSNQRTNLIAGSYVLTVTDINACQTTGTAVVINDQTSFTIDAAIENVSCNGFSDGAIDISITGTSDPYSFEWTNMLTDEDISLLAAGDYSVTVTDDNGCQANMDFTVTQPLVLVANVSFPGVQCFGGTTDVTVIGVDGTAPYIGETTINLYAGSYTATITDDNGCIASTDYEITEPLLLTASSSSTEILCYGELSTVTISASDGTAPYSGVGDFDIAAGSYTYTVTDDNGCTATTDIEILEPSELLVNVISTPIECFGGTSIVTVSANQGTAPYTGEGDFEVFAGEYDYQVTDNNGCVTTTNIIVTEPAEVTGSQTFTICAGETITIGTDVYNESGTYYYTLVGAATTGCDSVVTTYLTVNDVIDVSVTTNVNTITATEESATWQWINCDGNTIIDGETLRNFTATETGDYAVIVTQNNCSDTSDCVNIIVSEIGITNSNDNLVVYPNPTSSEITIETSIEEGSLTLYNSVGQIIWTGIISKEQKQTIVLSDYENGVYFVKIENAEKSFVKAIVKQ